MRKDIMKRMQDVEDIVIKTAGKRGAIVVWHRNPYVHGAIIQITNFEFYYRMEKNRIPRQQDIIITTIAEIISR